MTRGTGARYAARLSAASSRALSTPLLFRPSESRVSLTRRDRLRERAGLIRRVGTVVRWPLGMVLASWRYLWRTSPMYRFDEQGGPDDTGPPLPTESVDELVQGVEDGVGPLFRRRYSVRIEGSSMSPEQLI